MKSLSFFFQHRFSWMLSGAIIAAGGLALSGAAFGEQSKVSVKVDEQSIVRSDKIEVASFSPVVKRVGPSVVKVLVTERAKNVPMQQEVNPFFDDPMFRQFFGDPFGGNNNGRGRNRTFRQPQQQGLGSGVIVSSDGYILTNNHVVNGADVIKVTLSDSRELTAKVVGTDPQSDVAVIKVEAKDLPAITFADSDKIEVGDRVLAIGNPFGIGQTVTSGMISGLGREQGELELAYQNFIQTDAAINPGNSGGALVDVQGRLVGINTAILSRSGGFQGIGFAIPANWVRSIMEQLVSGGKIVRGYLGVTLQELTPELVDSFKLNVKNGALVSEVKAGSPAAKAGVKSGDVITQINGKKITDSRNLKFSVATIAPGTDVAIQVLREGKPVDIKIKVGENPDAISKVKGKPAPGSEEDNGTLDGVGVADLDQETRREFDIPVKIHGAIVTEVDPSSPAAAVGLQPGDVIQEINHKPVRSAEDAIKLTEKTETPKTLLKVWSPRGTRYIVVDESGE